MEDELEKTRIELNETKEHLKKYTAPISRRKYYENNKEKEKQRAKEYKQKTNYKPNIFNYDCVIAESLTLEKIELLTNSLSRKSINIKLENNVIGMNEYLTIIR